MDKAVKMLMDNKMSDGAIVLFCTKWNASIGPRYITTFEDSLYITPYLGGIYGVNIKKSVRLNRSDIADIQIKDSFWSGLKIVITVKDGRVFKFRLFNKSWLEPACLLEEWGKGAINVVKKTMTVNEAFLLDCRVTAKQLNANEENFTISELVHKVVDNDDYAEEWIKTCGDKIYNALKEDVKRGELKAKIVLVKRGEEILYGKIRFEVKK